MKNLTKLLLPLTLSTILNFNSKAQDFLPGKFKNYQSNKKDTLLRENSSNLAFKISTQNIYYDLDKDSVFDVVEIFLRDPKDGRISKNPFFYILNFNPYPVFLLDSKMDGLNGNEYFEPKENESDKNKYYL